MRKNNNSYCVKNSINNPKSSNVKSSPKYEHFGETIRYLTLDELQQFFDSIDNYFHKLMFRVIYELGCRVGEFTRIQIKHLNFTQSTVFFPAENTKTKHPRISCLRLTASVNNLFICRSFSPFSFAYMWCPDNSHKALPHKINRAYHNWLIQTIQSL